MSKFKFLVLGVGDAFSAKYYSSSLLLQFEESYLLIDCPHPIRKIITEASENQLDIDSVDAVALTHLHADHSSGLEGFAYYKKFFNQGKKPTLIAHPDVLEFLWKGKLLASMGYPKRPDSKERTLEDFFQVVELDENNSVTYGPFSIQCHKTKHPIPTTSFKISAGNKTLAYSADTPFDSELIQWLFQDSHLVIHETNLGSAHTPLENLLQLPDEIKEKMRLIHYPDNTDTSNCKIPCLIQGQWYTV